MRRTGGGKQGGRGQGSDAVDLAQATHVGNTPGEGLELLLGDLHTVLERGDFFQGLQDERLECFRNAVGIEGFMGAGDGADKRSPTRIGGDTSSRSDR